MSLFTNDPFSKLSGSQPLWFNSLLSVWKCCQTWSFMFDVNYTIYNPINCFLNITNDILQWILQNKTHQHLPIYITTVFVDKQLWKTKHPRKHYQNFRQSCVLLTDQMEIHQSQSLVWPSDFLYIMLAGCDWWISILYVDNMQDWWKFWKRFHGCFVSQSRISTKTVINIYFQYLWSILEMFLPMTSCILSS